MHMPHRSKYGKLISSTLLVSAACAACLGVSGIAFADEQATIDLSNASAVTDATASNSGQATVVLSDSFSLSSSAACSVRFIADDTSYVSIGSSRTNEFIVASGTTLGSSAPTATAKSGYVFDGWYLNGKKVTSDSNGLSSYVVNDACTFIAHSKKTSSVAAAVISGSTRFETAIEVSKIDEASEGVIIVNGRNFPDALSAAGLSGITGYQIFIVDSPDASTEVPEAVLDRIETIGAKKAIIVGGTGVVSESAMNLISKVIQDNAGSGFNAETDVVRISGSTRTETADAVFSSYVNTGKWSDTVIIATGYDWVDALSISPYATWSKSPIFLVDKNGDLSAATKGLISKSDFSRIVIVDTAGDEYGVSEATKSYCEGLVSGRNFKDDSDHLIELGGSNKYETSVKVAQWCIEQGMSYDGVGIVSGTSFVDSMVSAPCLGRKGSVVLLTDDSNDARAAFEPLISQGLDNITFIGGASAVPIQVRDEFLLGIKMGKQTEGSSTTGYAQEEMLGYSLTSTISSVVASIPSGTKLSYKAIDSKWATAQVDGVKCYFLRASVDSSLPSYKVTFKVDDSENGDVGGGESKTVTYNLGDKLSDAPAVSASSSCVFDGWYEDGKKITSVASLSGLYANGTTSYIAHFTKNGSISGKSISGSTRYDTAVEVSKEFSAGNSATDGVIIASGENFPDALAACSISGITGYHILLTKGTSLPDSVAAEIKRLGATKAYVIGGTGAVSSDVEKQLKKCGITSLQRLYGDSRHQTAEAVYKQFSSYWGDTVILATGANYPDSLSISPYSTYSKTPILLTTKGGELASSTFNLMKSNGVKNVIIVGGTGVVSSDIESKLRGAGMGVSRLGGSNRYETSDLILDYCLDHGMKLDGLGIVSGKNFPDALAGGALMGIQGKGILLVADSSASRSYFQKYITGGKLANVTFIGGLTAVPQGIRDEFTRGIVLNPEDDYYGKQTTGYAKEDIFYYAAPSTLSTVMGELASGSKVSFKYYGTGWAQATIGSNCYYVKSDMLSTGVSYENFNITLDQAVEMQYKNACNWKGTKLTSLYSTTAEAKSAVMKCVNPANYSTSNYMFLNLQGYTGISAAKIDSYLSGKGTLDGLGSTFVKASKDNNINEAYLIAHACLESANGSSRLAKGTYYDGTYFYAKKGDKTKLTHTVLGEEVAIKLTGYDAGYYYNFFGYGAVDSDPFAGGITTAVKQGWNSRAKAVTGGASKITGNYVNNTAYNQNTLYKMRFNPVAMESLGYITHQYATDIQWAESNAKLIKAVYDSVGGTYDTRFLIPKYK